MQEIESLKLRAEIAKQRERPGVIEHIKVAVEHYDLTADDLGLVPDGRSASRGTKKPAGAKIGTAGKLSAKFKDALGNSWSGRGPKPRWVKAHLEAGNSLSDLMIKKSVE